MECKLRKTWLFDYRNHAVSEIYVAASFYERLRGLLFREPLVSGQGLLIEKCNSIHTVGMSYPIDVCFLDENNIVTKIKKAVYGFNGAYSSKAKKVIEFCSGEVDRLNIRVGQKLVIRELL